MPLRVGAEPLAPAVALGGLDAGAEVVAEDVGESADAEVAGVLLVGVPGVSLEFVDGGDDCGVVAPGEAGPGVEDLVGGEVGVPGEAAETVEVRHGHRVMEPVGVEAYVGYSDEAAEWLMEGFAFDDFFYRGAAILCAEVGVEGGLPHGDEEDHVALLAEVLLGDLQLDGLAGVLERGEEGRDGFADLEVDGAVLDLDDDVGFELAVEGVEVVVAGAGAVGFEVVVVEVVVVDEAAVEDDAAVRFEGAGYGVGGFCWRSVILRGAYAAFGVGLDDEAGEVGDGFVDFVNFCFPPCGYALGRRGRRF